MLKKQILLFSLISCIVFLIFSFIVLKYINELEENVCVCSNHWNRDFIKYFTIIFIVSLLPYIFSQRKFLLYINNNFSILMLSILKFVSILYYIILVKYFIMLKNTECKCSENWKRKLFLYPIIVFSLMMIVLIFFTTKQTITYVLNWCFFYFIILMFKRFIVKHNKSCIVNFDDNLYIEDLHKYLSKILKYKNEDFFLTYNSKLLNKKRKISSYNLENNDQIEIIFRKRGGFIGMILAFAAVVAVLVVLAKPLIDMLKVMGHMLTLLFHFLAIFPPLLETILLLFDPKRLINDVIFGVTFGIKMLFSGIYSTVNSGLTPRKVPKDKSKIPHVCIPPTLTNLLVLVICPPLGLLFDRGLQGFFHVLVCAFLTVKLYYFPGLIYAALHILC